MFLNLSGWYFLSANILVISSGVSFHMGSRLLFSLVTQNIFVLLLYSSTSI
jgi:hypothetical protein